MAVSKNVEIIISAKDKASGSLKSLGKDFKNFAKDVTKLAAGIAGAVAGVTFAFVKMADRLGSVQQITADFDALSNSLGETADTMMGAFRNAVRGTMTEFDMMRSGSKLMSMGLVNNAEEMTKVVNIARRLGDQTVSTAENIENFSLLLANQSVLRLDTFGISSGKVRERIEELMQSTKGMTRETAFMTATMEEAEKSLSILGDEQDTVKTKIEGVKARFQDLIDNALIKLAPIIEEIANIVLPKLDGAITNITAILEEQVPKWSAKLEEAQKDFDDFVRGYTEAEDEWGGNFNWTVNNVLIPALRDLGIEVKDNENAWEDLGIGVQMIKEVLLTAGVLIVAGLAKMVKGWQIILGVGKQAWVVMVNGIVASINILISMINKLVETINKIPGFDLGYLTQQQYMSESDSILGALKGGASLFSSGGIVGGSSFSGDKVLAGLNSGEMVLNRDQQSQLFDMLNGGGTGSNVTFNVNIPLMMGDEGSKRRVAEEIWKELDRMARSRNVSLADLSI